MLFLAFLSMVMLVAHLLSPLGTYFSTWVSQYNPNLLVGLSDHIRYFTELFLLHLPALTLVFIFSLRIGFFDRAPARHPQAARFLLIGLALYFLFVIGRNTEGSLGNVLDKYIHQGLLFSRASLLIGCLQLLMNLQPSGKGGEKGGGGMMPGAGGGKEGGGDDAALAALMGMMGGGGPPPGGGMGGGGKAPPPRRRRNPDRF